MWGRPEGDLPEDDIIQTDIVEKLTKSFTIKFDTILSTFSERRRPSVDVVVTDGTVTKLELVLYPSPSENREIRTSLLNSINNINTLSQLLASTEAQLQEYVYEPK